VKNPWRGYTWARLDELDYQPDERWEDMSALRLWFVHLMAIGVGLWLGLLAWLATHQFRCGVMM